MVARPSVPADSCRGRLCDRRLDRSPAAAARGPVWRSPGLLQSGSRLSRAARRARLPSPRRDLAVYRGGPAAAGRHGVRPIDPRADRPGHPQRASRRPRGARGRRRRRAPAVAGHRQRAVRARRTQCGGRRKCSRWPMPCSARDSCRWPNTC